jgi:hypothetical protein
VIPLRQEDIAQTAVDEDYNQYFDYADGASKCTFKTSILKSFEDDSGSVN